MRPETILTCLKAMPFQPFRIIMNSGRSYEVKHPEFLKLTRDTVLFFHAPSPEGIFDRWEFLSLLLIERLEPAMVTTQ